MHRLVPLLQYIDCHKVPDYVQDINLVINIYLISNICKFFGSFAVKNFLFLKFTL